MASFLFGSGTLTEPTAARIQALADRYGVRFVRESTRFWVEADDGSDGRAAFTKALKRDDAFYQGLQAEAELSDGGGEDEDGIPW